MKRSLITASVLLSAAPLLAQTSATGTKAPPVPRGAAPAITISGCVAGQGSDAQPYVLNNAVVVSSKDVAPTPPALSPPLPAGASPTPPETAGTGGAGAAPTVGSAGTASGGTAAAIEGYRLSGSDMKPWAGQRVEIVGTVVKRNPAVSSGAGVAPSRPELRVQSVHGVAGTCPQS